MKKWQKVDNFDYLQRVKVIKKRIFSKKKKTEFTVTGSAFCSKKMQKKSVSSISTDPPPTLKFFSVDRSDELFIFFYFVVTL